MESEKARRARNLKQIYPERKSDEPQANRQSLEEATSEEIASEPDAPHLAEKPTAAGKLIVNATVADQAICYPTGLNLLNEAREFSEKIIDTL